MIAAFVLAGGVVAGTVMVGPETVHVDEIYVSAFNIQVFGKTKRAKQDVMEVLAEIAHQFDVMVVQEIRDASEETADIFLDRINENSQFTYAMYEGPRLGRTNSKEQYVVYYIPAVVDLVHAYTLPDEADEFERPPLVATFKSRGFDFTLVACHIKPDHAEQELKALEKAVADISEGNPGELDIILLGDFNADGSYLDEDDLPQIFPTNTYSVVISDEKDTMTTSDNTYDRIILMSGTMNSEFLSGSAFVYRFDEEHGLTDDDFVRKVSDHFPVYGEFRVTQPDDD
jgi:endonuclease/exonuclease/phosphatase family metal-dependent hydrolase